MAAKVKKNENIVLLYIKKQCARFPMVRSLFSTLLTLTFQQKFVVRTQLIVKLRD